MSTNANKVKFFFDKDEEADVNSSTPKFDKSNAENSSPDKMSFTSSNEETPEIKNVKPTNLSRYT